MPSFRTVAAPALSALLIVSACGGDDDVEAAQTGEAASSSTEAPAAEPEFPVLVTADNGPVEIEAEPQRIVSLSPTATEMLFAIEAGDQVVAVDDKSTYPPEAPRSTLSGFEPNVEAVVSFEPDLVVLSDDIADVVAGLTTLDVPVVQLGAAVTLDDTFRQIETLGDATGHPTEAESLVEEMQAEIDDLVASLPEQPAPPTYYHELDPTLFSATSSTFIGEIYTLAGLENIADAADTEGSGYLQLSAEFLIDADPDLIFLADTRCCHQDAAAVAARPGWDGLTAVLNEGVVELDDDIASRWGPRIVDFLETVVEATSALPAS